ncbi:MAG TPA: hypothetical protein DER33_04715 [Syntrophomonas sp.]|nr:hypothetical protein [Syntrophomonas sp.]
MNYEDNRPVIDDRANDSAAFLKVLKKRFGLIAAITLFFAVVGAALSYFVLPPVYEAKTTILVTQATQHLQAPNQKDDFSTILQSVARIPVLTMSTYVEQVKSEILLQRVIKRLNLGEQGVTVRSLAARVNVSVGRDSNFIEVSVRDRDPNLAVEITSAIAGEYLLFMNEKNLELIDRSIRAMQDQAAVIYLKLAAAPLESEQGLLQQTLGFLEEKINQAKIVRAIESGSARLVVASPPMLPDRPVKPDKLLNIAMAFMLGLTASVMLAFFLEACVASDDECGQRTASELA